MEQIWMAISPGPTHTRVIATSAEETILKGRLLPNPAHPRALQWLLEAVALWQGKKVRAALVATDRSRLSAPCFEADWFPDFGEAMYELELWDRGSVRRRGLGDRLQGMGEFRDLKQLRLAELEERRTR